MRKISLNFGWEFKTQFDKDFRTVNIPHTVLELPLNNFDETSYQFLSTYKKTVEITAEMLEKRLFLSFEGVSVTAEVFVNGKFAFSHKGSYTAFGAEINEFLTVGKNAIEVKVDSSERIEVPPFGGQVDYLGYGGIYREVFLIEYDDVYISQIKVHAEDVLAEPKLVINLKLNKKVEKAAFAFVLKDKGGFTAAEATAEIAEADGLSFTLETPAVKLWDLQNPNLYFLHIKLIGGEERVVRAGFREAKFTKNGFFLNGEAVKIRGLNRHQSYPYVGYAMPASAQIADADLLKFKLGVNLVRTSHYPQSRHFLDRCDEIGLLVFTEIPGWQHVSDIAEWRDLTLKNVEDMITENCNHPSVILWGVRINESGDDRDLYTKTNSLARRLDPSRQTGGVRVNPRSEMLEDVFTLNDFSESGGKMSLMPKFLTKGRGKPYLITEHNGHMFPTKSFDPEGKRQEHALRHAKVLNKAYKTRGISGAIGWCMSDYNTHKDFGSGDKICYHGVTDIFRAEKPASWAYISQQDEKPFLKCGGNLEIGDHPAGMTGRVYFFTNCEEIKVYKNGAHISTIDVVEAGKKSAFKHLPHPLIPFDDQIGNLLEADGFSKGKEKAAKKLFSSIHRHGVQGGVARALFSAFKLLVIYKMSITDITDLFGKYASVWGGKQNGYRFEGLIGGKVAAVCEAGSVFSAELSVKADKLCLQEKDTYDVTRIEVKALSQLGNVLPYASDVVEVEAEAGALVIGPKKFALIGGQRAFWIKTTGKTGNFGIKIKCDFAEKVLNIEVKK